MSGSRATEQRRRLALTVLGAAALLAFAAGVVAGGGRGDAGGPDSREAAELAELPGGGRTIFPENRVVALYGAPQDPELGALGVGTPDQAGRALARQARAYEGRGRPVLPAMELIATIAAEHPGEEGEYNLRQPRQAIERYLRAARKRDALLILDLQPGHADFMDEARRLRRYLREPDVGLALDPEWHLEPPDVPGQVIGSVDAEKVNQVSAFLDEIVSRRKLPQKLFVVHQFTEGMIANREMLEQRQGLAIVLNSDGFGNVEQKREKYKELRPRGPTRQFDAGFKLFYSEDVPVMSPTQVMKLRPEPDLVVYE